MSKLPKIERDGSDAARVTITGNPRNLEPTHVRIVFPGGEVEVTRASDGEGADYWCHVKINHPKDSDVLLGEAERAHVTDARIDLKNKSVDWRDAGELRNPELYHLAVRVTRGG